MNTGAIASGLNSRTGSVTLESERLKLIPFAERFLTNRYVGWLNDPEVTRFSNQRFRRHTLDSCRSYVESFRGSDDRLWAIVRKADEEHVGNLCATVENQHGVADLSILIGERSAWGGGIGSEAWQTASDYLLDEVKLRKVTGGTLACNHGMLRVMTKCGMHEEGRRKRHYLVDGEAVDMVYFARFADPGP